MDDKESLPVVSRDVLVKRGTSAILYLAGGIYLLVMAIGGKGILGLVLPLIALVIGIAAFLSKDREDNKPGLFLIAAGTLGILTRFVHIIRPITGTVLGLGALGLIAAGIWKGVGFLLGLRSRT